MKPKVEKVLEELDGIFKSRDRTLEVLLGSWLESVLPERIENHSLEEADTLPKLCDMFLAWRSEEKVKAIGKIAGIEDEAPVKLSAKAMQHLESLGLLRSDLKEAISDEEVFRIDAWEAGCIQAQRFLSEGNIEELAPLAKERIRRLGGSDEDLALIENEVKRAEQDDIWRYGSTQNIFYLMFYAEVRVISVMDVFCDTHEMYSYGGKIVGENLIDKFVGMAQFIAERHYTRMARDEQVLEQATKTAKRLRQKLKRQGKLENDEIAEVLRAEKIIKEITERHGRYKQNLNERLEKYKNGEKEKN